MSWWQHLLLSLFFFPPLGFVGGWCRKRCCQPGCTFFSDSFNRADDDDIGNGWNEESGDGDISSNDLTTASSNAVFIQDEVHPDGDPDIKITATFSIPTSGDTARVIVNYTNTSNYWFAEVRAGSGAYLRIYQRSGGSNTLMSSISGTVESTVTICVSVFNNFMSAKKISGASLDGIAATGSFAGPEWGVGTGTISGTVSITQVSAAIVNGEDCKGCGLSCAKCEDSVAPAGAKVVITGMNGDSMSCCTAYNGTWYQPFTGVDNCGASSGTPTCCYRNADNHPNTGFCNSGIDVQLEPTQIVVQTISGPGTLFHFSATKSSGYDCFFENEQVTGGGTFCGDQASATVLVSTYT
jgi:hypothetical protein